MTDTNTPDTNTPPAADPSSLQAPASAPTEASAPPSPTTALDADAVGVGAPSASDSASSSSETSAAHDSAVPPDEEGDEEAEGGAAEAANGAPAAPGAEGTPKKRRRRRRKKKGPQVEGRTVDGSGASAPAEGGAAEGSAAPPREPRPPKPKRERVERERPAFNVGDVVFGKVIEFTEDALFVDLSGKARAIFDLRELLITEDDVEEYTKADKREADELAAARAASAASGTSGDASSVHVDGDAASGAAAPAEAPGPEAVAAAPSPDGEGAALAGASTTAEAVPVAAEAVPVAVEAAPAEGTSEVATAEPPMEVTAAEAEEKTPQLPRVILEPGASFVGLVHNDGGRGGLVVLTHHPKRAQKTKPVIAEASRSGALVFGLVTGTIKGGVEVDVDGLRAFAPASHVELRPGADLSHLVGKRLPFAVTQYAKRGRDVVLSRRALLESEAKERREEALKNIEMGGVVEGVVRTVVPFGAFVDVGGVEGLVPLSEMSHNRADQPKDVFKVGETVKVKILRLDERGKLWLSRKAAIEDPWNQVAAKYSPGTRHTGKVARLQPFGAFVELEPGIDGLIHTADLSVKRIEHPEELVKVDQEIEVVVASVDPKQHRIALHPAPTGEAANETPQRVQLHKTVKVVVVSIDSGGLVVRVLGATGRNARGFISAAATGTPRGTELRKLFPVGKQLEAKIIEHDPRRGELKLSIKALNEENERSAFQQYRAQVKREAKFGTLADLLAKRNITPTK